ncbi:MAG: hypothetical protein R3B48_12115 [Kofleriaceae bacterium]
MATHPAGVVGLGVLLRVVLLGLGALLVLATGALLVQVRRGPSAGGAGLEATAAGVADDAPVSAAPPAPPTSPREAAPTVAPGAPASAAPSPPEVSAAEATAIAANLSFDEANKLYDRRDYDEARALALTLLVKHPSSVRMRRVVVASSCIMGDHDVAQQHYLLLPERDRADMRQRCVPYGSTFHE